MAMATTISNLGKEIQHSKNLLRSYHSVKVLRSTVKNVQMQMINWMDNENLRYIQVNFFCVEPSLNVSD